MVLITTVYFTNKGFYYQLEIIAFYGRFSGIKFGDLCWELYNKHQVCIIGIYDKDNQVIFGNMTRVIKDTDSAIMITRDQINFDTLCNGTLPLENLVFSSQETSFGPLGLSNNENVHHDNHALEGHVIVCGAYTKLLAMIKILKSQIPDTPIVLISEHVIDHKDTTGVLVVHGRLMDRSTWNATNMHTCSHIALLLPDNTPDSPSILLYFMVMIQAYFNETCRRPFVTVEIADIDQVRFFHQFYACNNALNWTSSGVNSSSRSMENGYVSQLKPSAESYFYYHVYMSGHVVVTSFLNTILYQTFYTPQLAHVFTHLCGLQYDRIGVLHPLLRYGPSVTRPVAWRQHKKNLLLTGVVAIGIYRYVSSDNKRYAIMLPDGDELVNSDDKVFVI